jgi:hypothetical protein
MATSITQEVAVTKEAQRPAWLELVRRQTDSLQYGVVQIVVHDGRVIQIERTERVRLAQSPEAG